MMLCIARWEFNPYTLSWAWSACKWHENVKHALRNALECFGMLFSKISKMLFIASMNFITHIAISLLTIVVEWSMTVSPWFSCKNRKFLLNKWTFYWKHGPFTENVDPWPFYKWGLFNTYTWLRACSYIEEQEVGQKHRGTVGAHKEN